MRPICNRSFLLDDYGVHLVVGTIGIYVKWNIVVGICHENIFSQDSFHDFKCFIWFWSPMKGLFTQFLRERFERLCLIEHWATWANMCWQHHKNHTFSWCCMVVLAQGWKKYASSMVWGQLVKPISKPISFLHLRGLTVKAFSSRQGSTFSMTIRCSSQVLEKIQWCQETSMLSNPWVTCPIICCTKSGANLSLFKNVECHNISQFCNTNTNAQWVKTCQRKLEKGQT